MVVLGWLDVVANPYRCHEAAPAGGRGRAQDVAPPGLPSTRGKRDIFIRLLGGRTHRAGRTG